MNHITKLIFIFVVFFGLNSNIYAVNKETVKNALGFLLEGEDGFFWPNYAPAYVNANPYGKIEVKVGDCVVIVEYAKQNNLKYDLREVYWDTAILEYEEEFGKWGYKFKAKGKKGVYQVLDRDSEKLHKFNFIHSTHHSSIKKKRLVKAFEDLKKECPGIKKYKRKSSNPY